MQQRIAHQLALHRSLLHLQYNLPLSPPPEPSSFPSLPSYASHPHHHDKPALDRTYTYSAHDTYPSPTTSSPPGLGSRSPPSHSSLGKRPRSPAPAYAYSPQQREREREQRTPPSRASPMSLRGILHDHPAEEEYDRARRAAPADSGRPQMGVGMDMDMDMQREVTYHRAPESSVRLSPGHRVSHERTGSRDELGAE
ncbi:hypothetical protein CALVIDRAFT_214584 [Calocera viscosa TUFC12733]|uniref:Uncharacterized protein n=1 Tax=Calocera viscosa (strain TUFC12733) TaxID=1330018 RepID=A0A167REL2_CALVF|nr:hypothetical protein CALVIDRAFT_214584 [Calocera viscosa TUFC12733]